VTVNLQVMEKYKWEGGSDPCPYLDPDINLLLQSIVMAIQGKTFSFS
jgi:hypothetical protein